LVGHDLPYLRVQPAAMFVDFPQAYSRSFVDHVAVGHTLGGALERVFLQTEVVHHMLDMVQGMAFSPTVASLH